MSFERGETFYYANRNTKQAEKCTVVDWICQYPMAYIAKNEASGEIFKCYSDFGKIRQCQSCDTYPSMLLLNHQSDWMIQRLRRTASSCSVIQ